MISIKSMTKTYKSKGRSIQALNGIDLEIDRGMFGLLGPNGAGKTTLMRILAGIVNPSSGRVNVAGNDLGFENGKQAVKAMLGYLPQELGMYPEMSAFQFVDYMAILKGMDDAKERRRKTEQVLEMVGLASESRTQGERFFRRDEAPRGYRPGPGE